MEILRRAPVILVSAGLTVSISAGCIPTARAPIAKRSASPTASPMPSPAFTGNLNTLLLPIPDWATSEFTHDGRLSAVRAAEMISMEHRDSLADRLKNLGYVSGVYRGWSGSGTFVEIHLLQYLDEDAAEACVSYLVELTGSSAKRLDGIDNGRWALDDDGRGIRIFFHRGGIAARMVIRKKTKVDVDAFLSLATKQYAKLPAA